MANMTYQRKIGVIGGGIIGLSCATYLSADPRNQITLIERPPGTDYPTSPAAAAFWTPYFLDIDARMGFTEAELALPTLVRFRQLARESVESCVIWGTNCHEYFCAPWRLDLAPRRWWHAIPEVGVRWLPEEKLPRHDLLGPIVAGCRFEVPIVHVEGYLIFLRSQLARTPRFRHHYQDVQAIDDLAREYDLVVNCAGLDAPLLTNDENMEAIQGQVLRVKNRTFARLIFLEEGDNFANEPLYIVPRRDDVILGGTVKKIVGGPITLKNADLMRPDPDVTARILERCAVFFPECKNSETEAMVRLRPKRKPLRIELDRSSHRVPVIHCYGHGGSGVTLSWGSAAHVGRLAARALKERDYDRAA